MCVYVSLRRRRGCKFQGDKLSTLASSQEHVLLNQTMNKHTLVQCMTHSPSMIFQFFLYLAPLVKNSVSQSWATKSWLNQFLCLFTHGEVCVSVLSHVSERLPGQQRLKPNELSSFIDPFVSLLLVIHPLGYDTSLFSPHV